MDTIIGTGVTLVALGVIIGLIIKSMVKDKKAGKSLHCGGDCRNCGGPCQ